MAGAVARPPRAAESERAAGAALRFGSAVRNLVELLRFGRTETTPRSPYEIAFRDPFFRLRRYGAGVRDRTRRPAILLVPPLMLTADVYDISVDGSAVALLLERGVDPWVVDFGAPERQKGGLRRNLTDHVLAVSRAVDRAREICGKPVHLGGYSQGGMFCYQVAAYRRSEGVASLVTFGSPVDVHRQLMGLPEEVIGPLVGGLGPILFQPFAGAALPPWLSRNVFRLLSPVKEIRSQIEFFTGLQDRAGVGRRQSQRRFLAGEGWVAWPGPALRDFVEQFLVHNRLFSGGFVVEGRTLALADITCPVLLCVGETDEIGRPAAVRAITEAAPRAPVFEVSLDAGHFGLVVGSKAMRETWPTVAAWLRWREGSGKRPARVRETSRATPRKRAGAEESLAGTLADSGREILRLAGEAAGERARTFATLARNVVQQVPRLARLEAVRRNTRIGLALALAEQAAGAPQQTFFLYEGRAYSYADANRRVDAVVRGLLSVGVRRGDHVGIFMRSRPSALALAAAVNRLGAVVVFLRPDGELGREIGLGEVDHLIADPDHAVQAHETFGRPVLVLGGGGRARKLPPGLVDMEAIDPERVAVPAWYEPNAGRAEEVAFILFSGRGENLRASWITNRRWALSALGTASAAALGSADTIYSWTPIHHPTGVLVSISAALIGGARLALGGEFSAATFWEEVRRYGASVVFYTGTMCRQLVDAPPDPVEQNHPVRLFAGSGMPRPVWRRLVERFGPVNVLEFYATTEGNAILANLSGAKIGSVGRALPGGAEVAIAAYDAERGTLVQDASGFCRRVGDGETGLLLARVERERGAFDRKPLRNVFEAADAWRLTGDLFRQDGDGDYWLVDHVADLIRGRGGVIPSVPIEEVVWESDEVSAAAAYGIRLPGLEFEVPAVAVVLRDGCELDVGALAERVLAELDRPSRPLVVREMREIPMTTGFRFLKEPLRAAGLAPREGERLWWFEGRSRTYRPLSDAALSRVVKALGAAGGRR